MKATVLAVLAIVTLMAVLAARLESARAAGELIPPYDRQHVAGPGSFLGSKAGDEREVAGIKLCWCPAGRFLMGSPPNEPERRPDEDQVVVTLTKGFWMGKYEASQGQWKRIIGKLPGELT